jgi:hypothetical protein
MTARPVFLTDRPHRQEPRVIDPLSQVLGSVRLSGGVFLEARFTAPWCTLSQITVEDIQPFIAAPGQIIAYHFVVSGRLLCSRASRRRKSAAARSC